MHARWQLAQKAKTHRNHIGISTKICLQPAHITWLKEYIAPWGATLVVASCWSAPRARQQNCIQNHFLFLYDRLNWLFYAMSFIKQQFLMSKKNVMCYKILYQTVLCLSQKKCMRWYSILFSIILGFVIPNSSNHCTRQRIFIMYSYICIMFYFCMHQNFVCHTKRVASVPSHHQPSKGSSIVSPPLIIPRKSIVSPPLISPPAHADLPSHVSSQTVNQPREEALRLCRQSAHLRLLEVALCCRRQSYQEKASCCRRWSVRSRMLTCRCT